MNTSSPSTCLEAWEHSCASSAGATVRVLNQPPWRTDPRRALDLMDCNGKLGLRGHLRRRWTPGWPPTYINIRPPGFTGTRAYVLSPGGQRHSSKASARPTTWTWGDVHLDGDTSIICICNGRYYGGGFMPVGEAQPDDGVLDMWWCPRSVGPPFFRLWENTRRAVTGSAPT